MSDAEQFLLTTYLPQLQPQPVQPLRSVPATSRALDHSSAALRRPQAAPTQLLHRHGGHNAAAFSPAAAATRAPAQPKRQHGRIAAAATAPGLAAAAAAAPAHPRQHSVPTARGAQASSGSVAAPAQPKLKGVNAGASSAARNAAVLKSMRAQRASSQLLASSRTHHAKDAAP